jgi:nucleoside-diphosphate-sugar epimerase
LEKGYRVNLDGTRGLLEAIRAADHKPKVVFTSSIAVFGAPFPFSIPDDFHLTPLTSYGTQKAICELLLADYTRRGFLDGVGIRLPTICVRPGKPNKAASGFFLRTSFASLSPAGGAIARRRNGRHTHASPRACCRISASRGELDASATRGTRQSFHARRVMPRSESKSKRCDRVAGE